MKQLSRLYGAVLTCAHVVAALALPSSSVSAQSLEDFVISGDAARRALTTTEISADTAQRITDSCVDLANENSVSVSIFILTPSGSIAHAHRMDGQTPINIDTALYKAETALYLRSSTHALSNRFSEPISRITRVKLDWYLVSGGLPIIVDDQLIGSIGVGGASGGFDERCAHHALTKVLGPQPPLTED